MNSTATTAEIANALNVKAVKIEAALNKWCAENPSPQSEETTDDKYGETSFERGNAFMWAVRDLGISMDTGEYEYDEIYIDIDSIDPSTYSGQVKLTVIFRTGPDRSGDGAWENWDNVEVFINAINPTWSERNA